LMLNVGDFTNVSKVHHVSSRTESEAPMC